jgi:hypothetical protein
MEEIAVRIGRPFDHQLRLEGLRSRLGEIDALLAEASEEPQPGAGGAGAGRGDAPPPSAVPAEVEGRNVIRVPDAEIVAEWWQPRCSAASCDAVATKVWVDYDEDTGMDDSFPVCEKHAPDPTEAVVRPLQVSRPAPSPAPVVAKSPPHVSAGWRAERVEAVEIPPVEVVRRDDQLACSQPDCVVAARYLYLQLDDDGHIEEEWPVCGRHAPDPLDNVVIPLRSEALGDVDDVADTGVTAPRSEPSRAVTVRIPPREVLTAQGASSGDGELPTESSYFSEPVLGTDPRVPQEFRDDLADIGFADPRLYRVALKPAPAAPPATTSGEIHRPSTASPWPSEQPSPTGPSTAAAAPSTVAGGAETTTPEAATTTGAAPGVASLHHQHLFHQQLYPATEIAPVIQA